MVNFQPVATTSEISFTSYRRVLCRESLILAKNDPPLVL
ncbi:hypothetical protein PAMC26577_11440 [Caballeronia sordidicola]|uniref:Uncharacterized protein n=1 Tax=Caballeronia sordidicola TaxID=196367 RepID=A0A242MZB2_CABSO|nr:hypothetical protein PAMC26577_11440 [Caballeronia sordidicola]